MFKNPKQNPRVKDTFVQNSENLASGTRSRNPHILPIQDKSQSSSRNNPRVQSSTPSKSPTPSIIPEMANFSAAEINNLLSTALSNNKTPKFDRSDVDSWLFAFETATPADDEKRIKKIVNSLSGDDLAWFKSIKESANSPQTFAEWKQKFIEKYTDKPSMALHKLAKRQQAENETPEKYCRDVLNLCRNVNASMSSEEKLHYLHSGLLEGFQDHMTCMNPKDEKEFQDYLERLEAKNKQKKKPSDLALLSDTLLTFMKQNSQQKPEPSFIADDNPRGYNQQRKTPIVCQVCEKPGHSALTCFKLLGYPISHNPRQTFDRNPRNVCGVCQKPGHDQSRCYQVIGYPQNSRGRGRQNSQRREPYNDSNNFRGFQRQNNAARRSSSPHPNAMGSQ